MNPSSINNPFFDLHDKVNDWINISDNTSPDNIIHIFKTADQEIKAMVKGYFEYIASNSEVFLLKYEKDQTNVNRKTPR